MYTELKTGNVIFVGSPTDPLQFNYYTNAAHAIPWNDYMLHNPTYIRIDQAALEAKTARIDEMWKIVETLISKVDKLENLVVAGAFAPGGILSTQAEVEFHNLLGDYIQNDAGKALKESVEVELQEEEVEQKEPIQEAKEVKKTPEKSNASKRKARRKRRTDRKNR